MTDDRCWFGEFLGPVILSLQHFENVQKRNDIEVKLNWPRPR